MRVHVSKPANGTVTIKLDDRRGLTGMRVIRHGVELSAVGATVRSLVDPWKDRLDAVERVRRGIQA